MYKMRAEITKGEEIRYISHLDYAAAIERAIKRSKLPAAYSEGFNPHMKIAFASALSVGVTSAAEYMDVELKSEVTEKEFAERLRAHLPKGIDLAAVRRVEGKQPALMAMVDLAEYVVEASAADDFSLIAQAVDAFNLSGQVVYLRQSPKGAKEIEIKQYMDGCVGVREDEGKNLFFMRIRITPSGSVKPAEVMKAMAGQFALPVKPEELLIHRAGLYAKGERPIEKTVWRG